MQHLRGLLQQCGLVGAEPHHGHGACTTCRSSRALCAHAHATLPRPRQTASGINPSRPAVFMNRGLRMNWYVRHWPTHSFVASILFAIQGVFMPPISPASWPFAVCALLALPVMAQVTPAPAAPTPASSASAATAQPTPSALPYASAFEGYQTFSEEKVRPWKESNTTVEKIGGWRTYAKEAAEPEAKVSPVPTASPSAPPAAPPKTPAATVDPHAGHGKH